MVKLLVRSRLIVQVVYSNMLVHLLLWTGSLLLYLTLILTRNQMPKRECVSAYFKFIFRYNMVLFKSLTSLARMVVFFSERNNVLLYVLPAVPKLRHSCKCH